MLLTYYKKEHEQKANKKIHFPINNTCFNINDVYIYSKFLYIHDMWDIPHILRNQSCRTKIHFRHCLSEMFYIKKAIHVQITSWLLYYWNGFHMYPHGTACADSKDKYCTILENNANRLRGASIVNITPIQQLILFSVN